MLSFALACVMQELEAAAARRDEHKILRAQLRSAEEARDQAEAQLSKSTEALSAARAEVEELRAEEQARKQAEASIAASNASDKDKDLERQRERERQQQAEITKAQRQVEQVSMQGLDVALSFSMAWLPCLFQCIWLL